MKKTAYLVGIGGIGVSALAQYLHAQGYRIHGSDGSENERVVFLKNTLGATVHNQHRAENVEPDTDVLIYSPAVPGSNSERQEAKKIGIPEFSYPEYLGKISEQKKTIAVAGTNGKTTTTSMVATILDEQKADPTVIVGGVMPRFDSNFRIGSSDLFVVEACEYKHSFVSIMPDVLVVTNVSHDHLDYFGSIENYQNSFLQLVDNVKPEGVIIMNTADPLLGYLAEYAKSKKINIISYSALAATDWNLAVPGQYNRENAAAAAVATAALGIGIDEQIAKKILEDTFETTKRRFEYVGKTIQGSDVYDDYAHNAEAVDLVISAAQEKFPNKKIITIFQPHLYSRTEEMKNEYVEILTRSDELFLLPIYPAREDPKNFSISSNDLIQAIGKGTLCESVEECVNEIRQNNFDDQCVILTLGAGVTDQLAKKLVL